MKSSAELRKSLESTKFPDLGAMMEGYARAAAEWAHTQFKQKLDFSSESVDALDEILVLVGREPELDVDFEVRLWGSYLGEVLRRRYEGSGDDAVPGWRGGRPGGGFARFAAVSADEG